MAFQGPVILGVAGASGSGKTTLARAVVEYCCGQSRLPDAQLLSLDAYYRDLTHLTFAERDRVNFDHPNAIEFELLMDHLSAWRAGRAVDVPRYDFAHHTRAMGTDRLEPGPLLIVEGLLLSADPGLDQYIDRLVFVDTDLACCLARRIERDGRERGRSPQSVRRFWEENVLPMYQTHGKRAHDMAHVIVNGEQPIDESRDAVLALLGLADTQG